MALSRVQASAKTLQVGASLTISLSTPPTVGNALIVMVAAWVSGPNLGACTDNRGNTYALAATQKNGTSLTGIYYCAAVATTGTPFQITATTDAGGAYWVGSAVEYSGVGTGLVVDRTTGATGSSTTPTTGTTAALTGADGVQAAVHAISGGNSTITVVSASPTWTQEFEELPFSNISGEGDTRVVSSATGTTPSCSWTDTAAAPWAAVLVAFTATGLVSTTPVHLSQLPIEVLRAAPPVPPPVRLSQLPLEVLLRAPVEIPPPPVPLQVTQLVVETLDVIPASPLAVTQVAAEILFIGPAPNEARVTQLACELIIVPRAQRPTRRLIRRLRRAPHVQQEHRRIAYARFALDLERGVGLVTGQGADPIVTLRLSRDGGKTWGEPVTMRAGRLGAYSTRVLARRLGQARDAVFEVTVSDPVAWSLVQAWLDLEPGNS